MGEDLVRVEIPIDVCSGVPLRLIFINSLKTFIETLYYGIKVTRNFFHDVTPYYSK